MPPYIPLHITKAVKSIWDRWNIRGAILFSLWLQVLLIMVAPLRKSARGKFNIILIWFAYLLADAAANFAVGLISNSQRNQYDMVGHKANQNPEENSDLLAFWAPFLLLHLGGPDTITAFALEDNELWLRHFLGLGFQAGAVIYVFIQSLPNKNLWIPTLLMFVAGMIKYGERTSALYNASLDKFRDSMLKEPDPGWSGSISSHNLIRYCLKSNRKSIHEFPSLWQIMFESILRFLKLYECFNKCATCICHVIEKCLNPIRKGLGKIFWPCFEKIFFFCAKDFMDEMVYVSLEPFSLDLWKFIFEELKTKSEFADTPETAKRISSARGEWALTDACEEPERGKLVKYLIDVPYDESILLWHIATDLCYHRDNEKDQKNNRQDDDTENPTDQQDNKHEELTYRQFSKTLSDYMLYLLVFRPTMMSAVAGIGKIRFRDTCAEAERFFKIRDLHRNQDEKACEELLGVRTDVGPQEVKGDRSKSVLFDACMLAKELNKMNNKWKIMSKVWVELVSYAASHCRASTHAADVSQGGELITFFWLLMAHFGLGEQFQINEGHARAKLIVGK
ncbi:hypothetical protein GOBAR_DD00961 [Gossypium barbadense]|nr:hypothetical protein GOBAR_DD00961 [Gossypium barbadense]